MSDKVKAHATIQATIQVKILGGPWPEQATVAEVHRQALESASEALDRANKALHTAHLSIVGKPQVLMVTHYSDPKPLN